ncbi:MAG: WbuC family cupin fold metalloprotein [Gammaproteobacteria bacterium]
MSTSKPSDAPAIKTGDDTLFGAIARAATDSPRLRAHHCYHPDPEDGVNRFLNVMQPGTYCRPHHHAQADKWEAHVLLRGAAVVLIFDAHGRVTTRHELPGESGLRYVELPPGTWHTLACTAPDTVLLELKPGPYIPASDKDFAPWAPAEGETGCAAFERWFQVARPGDRADAHPEDHEGAA